MEIPIKVSASQEYAEQTLNTAIGFNQLLEDITVKFIPLERQEEWNNYIISLKE